MDLFWMSAFLVPALVLWKIIAASSSALDWSYLRLTDNDYCTASCTNDINSWLCFWTGTCSLARLNPCILRQSKLRFPSAFSGPRQLLKFIIEQLCSVSACGRLGPVNITYPSCRAPHLRFRCVEKHDTIKPYCFHRSDFLSLQWTVLHHSDFGYVPTRTKPWLLRGALLRKRERYISTSAAVSTQALRPRRWIRWIETWKSNVPATSRGRVDASTHTRTVKARLYSWELWSTAVPWPSRCDAREGGKWDGHASARDIEGLRAGQARASWATSA